MLTHAHISRLFDMCPPLLWPVLAISLVVLRRQLAALVASGCTAWEIALTPWGRVRIVWADRAGAPLPWRDQLFRAAMGDPEPAPAYAPPSRGICTDESQVHWALADGQAAIPPLSAVRRAALFPSVCARNPSARPGRAMTPSGRRPRLRACP